MTTYGRLDADELCERHADFFNGPTLPLRQKTDVVAKPIWASRGRRSGERGAVCCGPNNSSPCFRGAAINGFNATSTAAVELIIDLSCRQPRLPRPNYRPLSPRLST
jgi:hypothetical protein